MYPAWGNHIEPRVLGIPWSFAYVLLVIASNFVVLSLAYRARIVEEDASEDGSARLKSEPGGLEPGGTEPGRDA